MQVAGDAPAFTGIAPYAEAEAQGGAGDESPTPVSPLRFGASMAWPLDAVRALPSNSRPHAAPAWGATEPFTVRAKRPPTRRRPTSEKKPSSLEGPSRSGSGCPRRVHAGIPPQASDQKSLLL